MHQVSYIIIALFCALLIVNIVFNVLEQEYFKNTIITLIALIILIPILKFTFGLKENDKYAVLQKVSSAKEVTEETKSEEDLFSIEVIQVISGTRTISDSDVAPVITSNGDKISTGVVVTGKETTEIQCNYIFGKTSDDKYYLLWSEKDEDNLLNGYIKAGTILGLKETIFPAYYKYNNRELKVKEISKEDAENIINAE